MKKALNILGNILIVIVFIAALTVSIMVFSSRSTGFPNVLGYSPLSILTDSMEPQIMEGDLIIIKTVEDKTTLRAGDVITYKALDSQGKPYINTHRITRTHTYPNGNFVVYTKGDHNLEADQYETPAHAIVGKWTGQKATGMGEALDFVKSRNGIMFMVVIPVALLFLWQVYGLFKVILERNKAKTLEEVGTKTDDEKQKIIDEYLKQQENEKAKAAEAEKDIGNTESTPEKKE